MAKGFERHSQSHFCSRGFDYEGRLRRIEVFVSSDSDGNPFKPGEKEILKGLYCETVIKTKKKLLIPNALIDPRWNKNPDIKLGLIAYLGFPLICPDGKVFGSICVLDNKENEFSNGVEELIFQLKELVNSHLELLFKNKIIGNKIAQQRKTQEQLKKNQTYLEKVLTEQTLDLESTNSLLHWRNVGYPFSLRGVATGDRQG